MPNQYTKIASPFRADWQPAKISLGLEQALDAAHEISNVPIYIGQPPYNTKNKASAGTHDKRNCADLYGRKGREKADLEALCKALRLLGWPGWVRDPSQGNWPWHLHFLKHDDKGLASLALQQDDAYVNGFNGLGRAGRGGKDYNWRPKDPEVFHLYKRTDVFRVTREVGGFSQAGKPSGYRKVVRAPGYMIKNHVITVRDGKGKQYVVTANGTFYDRSRLVAVR